MLGLFPAQPPPGLISLSLLADETVTLEITEPVTTADSIHMLGAFFFFAQQDVRVGFFLDFSEAVESSCRML